jgi:hypothetical protein
MSPLTLAAALIRAASVHPLDPTTAGTSVDGVLAILPVAVAVGPGGYALDLWLRNDHHEPIVVSMGAARCRRGSVEAEVTLDPPVPPNRDGELWLPLVPGEASRLRLGCAHPAEAAGPFGLAFPEIRETPTRDPERALLTEVVWQLHEAALDPDAAVEPVALSYRRPPAAVASTAVPPATRVVLPLQSGGEMDTLGFVPWVRRTWRRGRWIAGPDVDVWRVHRREAERLWAEGSPRGWALEARVRLRGDATSAEGCVGAEIGAGYHAVEWSLEPGQVRIGRHTAPAVTDRFATWRVETEPQQIVVTRNGAEVLRVPRLTGWEPGLVFGQLQRCGLRSEWRWAAFEVDLGAPLWTEPWPETWDGYGVGAAADWGRR